MVPSDFSPFFVATAGAAAALVGLLFIAVSIAPERIAGAQAPVERRLVASAVFGFLSDAFFVSLGALIPGLKVGTAVLVFGLLYFAAFVPSALAATLPVKGMRRLRRATLPLTASIVYGWQILIAISLIRTPEDLATVLALPVLIMVMFGLSLVRAWELLGASRLGLLARLSPLVDVEDAPRPTNDGTPGPAGESEPRAGGTSLSE